MNGSLMLLVARTEWYNSVRPKDHPPRFSWFCGKPEKYDDRWGIPDLCQLLVYPLSQEVEADNMFQLCNERMIKKYHEEEVIYSLLMKEEFIIVVYRLIILQYHQYLLPDYCSILFIVKGLRVVLMVS
jgi:hypothetical protein